MSELLERDTQELKKAAKHKIYRDLVEKDRYQEYAERTYGVSSGAKSDPEHNPYNRGKRYDQENDYVASRISNASDVAKGVYTPSFETQAPVWNYVDTLPEVQQVPEKTVYVESDDVKPTATTTQYASVIKEQKTEVAVDEYITLSASAKVVIAVLATVVLAIIALIWVNASVINSLSAESVVIEQQIASLSSQLLGINEQIASATSEEAIMQFVQQAGMILG